MTQSGHRRFLVPPGWPTPPPGWVPPPDWKPDPTWPAAPSDWVWWSQPAPVPKRPGMAWIIAGASMLPFSLLLLVIGLATTGLFLVYVSIAMSVAAFPLVAIGVIRLALAGRSRT